MLSQAHISSTKSEAMKLSVLHAPKNGFFDDTLIIYWKICYQFTIDQQLASYGDSTYTHFTRGRTLYVGLYMESNVYELSVG